MENTKTLLREEIKTMQKEDKVLLITAANKYTAAKRSGQNVQSAYGLFINAVVKMQEKYGFTVLDGENNKKIMDEFAATVELATNAIMGQRSFTVSFDSVEKANEWLETQNNIVVKNMSIDARTFFGVTVKKVTIEYIVCAQPTQKHYGIKLESKVRFFVASNLEKYAKKWKESNPELNLVMHLRKKWGFFLVGGSVGFFRFINEKHFMLFSY